MAVQQDLSGQVGRYRILRKIGAGGMGSVYLAEDTRLPRKVALKVPHDTDAQERFRREAALAAGIEHPHLCPVLDVEEIPQPKGDKLFFFTMPYIEGKSLSQLIERGKPWPTEQAIDLLVRLSSAVEYLHRRGIIHRDLKPSNVIVRPSGEPVLMDFGLACDYTSQDIRLTRPGLVLGSPAYMAPERVAGASKFGPPVDVYALGVMLFELLTGRLPFDAPVPTIYLQIDRNPPPEPISFCPTLDPRLNALCLKALSKKPEDRPASAEAFAAELERVGSDNRATLPPSPKRGRVTHNSDTPETIDPHAANLRRGDTRPGDEPVDEPESPAAPTDTYPMYEPRPHRGALWSMIGMALIILFIPAGWILLGLLSEPVVSNGPPPDKEKEEPPKQTDGTRVEPPKERVTPPPPPRVAPAPARAPFDADKAKKLQQDWAAYLGRKVEEEYDLGDGVKLTLLLIPPGTFEMGSKDEKERFLDEVPHPVEITQPFYLGKYEVTQEQFAKVAQKAEENYFSATGGGKALVKGLQTKRFPVENVSWEEATRFCTALSQKLGRKVVLPSEAQWEYACRAGTTTPFHFGPALNGTEANCEGTTPYGTAVKGPNKRRTVEVGSYRGQANAWGLYDMHGNVWEWCQDYYGPYAELPTKDPIRLTRGKEESRVSRGGAWDGIAAWCRSAHRDSNLPTYRNLNGGFRVALRID